MTDRRPLTMVSVITGVVGSGRGSLAGGSPCCFGRRCGLRSPGGAGPIGPNFAGISRNTRMRGLNG